MPAAFAMRSRCVRYDGTRMPTHLTPETFTFLRGLARHNDREWFEARRPVYERAVRAPMLALTDEITHAMETFAPDHLRPANKVVLRIYRDTRFSANKLPYKTHLAAWWARRGMEKTSGGGYYLQIAPAGVMLAAGVYMPQREQLLQLRRWMSANHQAYRTMTKKLLAHKTASFTAIDPQALTRMPKGFAKDDPADELVRATNWGVSCSLPAEAALQPAFVKQIVQRLRLTAPLVDTLNAALAPEPIPHRRPLF
jgi:uncharacterized protein (TIGR02453 family)